MKIIDHRVSAQENLSTVRSRRHRAANPRPLVGVDGEGQEVDGRHVYTFLRAGEETVYNPAGLSTGECLEFLAGLDPQARYVSFAFGYDVTMICSDLSLYKLERLVDRESRARKRPSRSGKTFKKTGNGYHPLEVGDFEIEWMPTREFKVRRIGSKQFVVVNDVWGFFQSSFMAALERWDVGTPAERSKIEHGKMGRSEFEAWDISEVADYNRLECVLLVQLMGKFTYMCEQVGYVPRKLQGAGQLAEAIYRAHNVPETKDIYHGGLEEPFDFGRKAYYGGRFEQAYFGHMDQPIYQYDINSAYPHAMVDRRIPCLSHGSWRPVPPGRPPHVLQDVAILRGQFDSPDNNSTGIIHPLYMGLPFRDWRGGIQFPVAGDGWYWSFEIEASIHQTWKTWEGWEYVRECDCRPYGFVEDLYYQRKRLGKNGRGLVLKLGLNSLYGKMAQSVGNPKYANPIHASFITAHCRTNIQKLIHSLPECAEGRCGDSVAFVATDAIATIVSNAISSSDSLGGWSADEHPDGMFLVQPGLYFGSKGGRSFKTRGVAVRRIIDKREQFETAFHEILAQDLDEDFSWWKKPECVVTVPDKRLIGIRQAVAWKRMDLLGQWPDASRDIGFYWGGKRARAVKDNGLIKTYPYCGEPLPTHPYTKEMGGFDHTNPEALAAADSPDWARY